MKERASFLIMCFGVQQTHTHTHLLHCKWRRAFPAFLCPTTGSAAPGWTDRTGLLSPSFHLSPCLFLCLVLSPFHRSVAAGGEPQAGGPWQSQQQPDNEEQREMRSIRWLQVKKNKRFAQKQQRCYQIYCVCINS